MGISADLQNDSNWIQSYQEEKNVIYDAAGGYTALPAFEIPISFDKKILAIRTNSAGAKFTWRFSGVLSQRLQLGGGFTPLPVASSWERRLRINRSQLLLLPLYTSNYELLFEPYPWIKNISLTIWEYIGIINDPTEDLINEIRSNELARIEERIDDLASWSNP